MRYAAPSCHGMSIDQHVSVNRRAHVLLGPWRRPGRAPPRGRGPRAHLAFDPRDVSNLVYITGRLKAHRQTSSGGRLPDGPRSQP